MSPSECRTFFTPHVSGFSLYLPTLATPDGARFRAECAAAGKAVVAWTVNDVTGMMECVRWGLGAVITDKPGLWAEIKAKVSRAPRVVSQD